MSDGLSQSDLDALFAGSGDTGTAEAEKKKADVKQEMSDGLSQSDLDALFAGFGDTGTEEPDKKKADAKQELSDGLSQSDLDALFSGFDTGPAPPAAGTKSAPAIDMNPAWETPPETSEDKGEVLSQDDIDKLLAMYGS